ncbi:MAG: hypothetical protein ABI702_16345 [Burkholderiales bacterium]
MNRVFKTLAWTVLVALAVSVAIVASVASAIGPLDQTVIHLDGAPIALAQFDAGHWLAAVGAVLLALIVTLFVVLLVVPVAVLVPLALAALVLVGALALVAGIAAIAFSPLILCAGLVWLIWRLARGPGSTPKPGATMPG